MGLSPIMAPENYKWQNKSTMNSIYNLEHFILVFWSQCAVFLKILFPSVEEYLGQQMLCQWSIPHTKKDRNRHDISVYYWIRAWIVRNYIAWKQLPWLNPGTFGKIVAATRIDGFLLLNQKHSNHHRPIFARWISFKTPNYYLVWWWLAAKRSNNCDYHTSPAIYRFVLPGDKKTTAVNMRRLNTDSSHPRPQGSPSHYTKGLTMLNVRIKTCLSIMTPWWIMLSSICEFYIHLFRLSPIQPDLSIYLSIQNPGFYKCQAI